MEPRARKRGRKLYLDYTLPHRIHCSHVCPTPAPNGSSVIIYGHERGLRILWRGGRRRKAADQTASTAFSQTSKSQEIIILDSDDEAGQPTTNGHTAEPQEPEYEEREEEQDPDCPCPPIIEDVDLDLGCAVLHLAVPSPAALPNVPHVLKTSALVLVACADGTESALLIPLAPPADFDKLEYARRILIDRTALTPAVGPKQIARSIAAKFMPPTKESLSRATDSNDDGIASLLFASASKELRVVRLTVFNDHLGDLGEHSSRQWNLPTLATSIYFHPSTRSAQLLLTDALGAVRIFDPMGLVPRLRPSSRDSDMGDPSEEMVRGKWIMSFLNPPKPGATISARRKHTLASTWILGGGAIIVLLDDGEWGVWDVAGTTSKAQNPSEFVLRGYLTSTLAASDAAEPSKPKKTAAKLAPMTPNTRKVKAANLFSGPVKAPGVPSFGGISVVSSSFGRGGHSDESLVLWYNNEIYSIPSTQVFWQRATSSQSGSSLHGPNLTQITDVNLMNEHITSVAQIGDKRSSAAGLGQMNNERDLLFSTEHRIIILQTLRAPTPPKALFQAAVAERPVSRDQEMLDAGTLDLGGMDRLLGNMADGTSRPRKVGFAQD